MSSLKQCSGLTNRETTVKIKQHHKPTYDIYEMTVKSEYLCAGYPELFHNSLFHSSPQAKPESCEPLEHKHRG